jgi:hypothetical protein
MARIADVTVTYAVALICGIIIVMIILSNISHTLKGVTL